MKYLTGFSINRSGTADSYIFEWKNKNDAGAMESYTYKGVEPPRPELLQAAANVGALSARMISLDMTAEEVQAGSCFCGLKIEYPADGEYYRLRIKASIQLPLGYMFKYETPNWRVWCTGTKGEFNNKVREIVQKLLQECWKYIDGERAQTKLRFTKEEEERAEFANQ